MPQPFSKSICVFCGSRFGIDTAYKTAAQDLGAAIASAKYRLVYGAGDVGLMGAVATAAQSEGGQTFGVIPVHLLEMEVGKRDLSTFIVTENMHERKKVMFMNADATVTLPGGAGSMDELFEVLTWRQLGLHNKPAYLLNINGYWDPLIALLNHMVKEGFAEASFLNFLQVVKDVETLMVLLEKDLA